MVERRLWRNWGLDLVRATEAAARAAGRWMGLGNRDEADLEAIAAMYQELQTMEIAGLIVSGEEHQFTRNSPLASGRLIGTGDGPEMDIVLDPIDGRNLLAQGRSGAIAVVAAAPRGTMWAPLPARYMDKIVVNEQAAHALVPECLDAPAAWTLALVARAKHKEVRDLVVFVLERPRHDDLIAEIRAAGARVMLRTDGDIAGALLAASPDGRVDIMLGVGGVSEGLIAACGVRSLGGAMLGRLAPQSEAEREAVLGAGLDVKRIMLSEELIRSDHLFFAATGISDGPLLAGVRYQGKRAETQSIVLRCDTRTRRVIRTEHLDD